MYHMLQVALFFMVLAKPLSWACQPSLQSATDSAESQSKQSDRFVACKSGEENRPNFRCGRYPPGCNQGEESQFGKDIFDNEEHCHQSMKKTTTVPTTTTTVNLPVWMCQGTIDGVFVPAYCAFMINNYCFPGHVKIGGGTNYPDCCLQIHNPIVESISVSNDGAAYCH